MDKEHFMVGKTINKVEISEDRMALRFLCEDGGHIALTDAECCSHTWVEHVETPGLGFPCTVLEVVDLDMPPEMETEGGDYVKFYGLALRTDRGELKIEYRNASNGYYGGSLDWPTEGSGFYGSVYEQNLSAQAWREVKGD